MHGYFFFFGTEPECRRVSLSYGARGVVVTVVAVSINHLKSNVVRHRTCVAHMPRIVFIELKNSEGYIMCGGGPLWLCSSACYKIDEEDEW